MGESQRTKIDGVPVNVTVIILTLNEEDNIAQAIESVLGWADQVLVLDSGSTDRTCDIAARLGAEIHFNPFENYSRQRNHAIESLPVRCEWVFFLDADEVLTADLKNEIRSVLSASPKENGFLIKRRFIWMGQWLRRGYYPVWILRLFRKDAGRFEREINEHATVSGNVGRLQSDFLHIDLKSSQRWFERHIKYARLEAKAYLERPPSLRKNVGTLIQDPVEFKKFLRADVWNRLPLFLRPFLGFAFRTLFRGGLFDGRKALLYHFFQSLWYPLMIDLFILEETSRGETLKEQEALVEGGTYPPAQANR